MIPCNDSKTNTGMFILGDSLRRCYNDIIQLFLYSDIFYFSHIIIRWLMANILYYFWLSFLSIFVSFYIVSLSIERKRPIVIEHSRQPSVGLSVCVSVCPVHCGKPSDRI